MEGGDSSGGDGRDGSVDDGGSGGSAASQSTAQPIPMPENNASNKGVPKRPSPLRAAPSNVRGAGSSPITTLICALIFPGPALR